MLPRCVVAVALVLVTGSVAHSETFLATITKVEGNKVTFRKMVRNLDRSGGPAMKYLLEDPVTVEATADAAIAFGDFSDLRRNEPIEGGLNAGFFKTPTGRCLITVADRDDNNNEGKITAITVWMCSLGLRPK
jgi:hypothetical protein